MLDWSQAPSWAKFAAMNADGCWTWFEEKPTFYLRNLTWYRGGKWEEIDTAELAQGSLQERPKND
jgi:hypothetical protein